MKFTRRILIDVANEILSPSWQLRNAATCSFYEVAQFSPELISSFRWRDVIRHQAPTELVIRTPDVRALQLPSQAVPPFAAWATYAAERGWRANPDNLIFPSFRDHQYRLDEVLDLRYVTAGWEADDIAEPTNQDLRDVAALVLARVRGMRGDNPAQIVQMQWGDLSERDFKRGNEDHVSRISLLEVLEQWGEVWEQIVGREFYSDDPILIPSSTGRLAWAADEYKTTRPKPLSLAGYYSIFRRRGAMAGYPSLSATDCTVEDGDGTFTIETTF